MLINGEEKTNARIADLYGIIPSITGKVELVYEGELEGITVVAHTLLGKAIRKEFLEMFLVFLNLVTLFSILFMIPIS